MYLKSSLITLVFFAGFCVIDSQFQQPAGGTGRQFSFNLSPFPQETFQGARPRETRTFRRFGGQETLGSLDQDLQFARFGGTTLNDLPAAQRADVMRQLRANGITVSGNGAAAAPRTGGVTSFASRTPDTFTWGGATTAQGFNGITGGSDMSRRFNTIGGRRVVIGGTSLDNSLTPRVLRTSTSAITGATGRASPVSFRGMPTTFGNGRFSFGDTRRTATTFPLTTTMGNGLPTTGLLRGLGQDPNALFLDPVSGQRVRILSNNAANSFVSRRTSAATAPPTIRRLPTAMTNPRVPTVRSRAPTVLRRPSMGTISTMSASMPRSFARPDTSFGTAVLRPAGFVTQFNDFGFAPLAIPLNAPPMPINSLRTRTGDADRTGQPAMDWSLFNSVLAQNGLLPDQTQNRQTNRVTQPVSASSSQRTSQGASSSITLDSLDLSMFDPSVVSGPVAATPLGAPTSVSFGNSMGSRRSGSRFVFGVPATVSTARFDITRPAVGVNRRFTTVGVVRPPPSTSIRRVTPTSNARTSSTSFSSTNRIPRVVDKTVPSRVSVNVRSRTDTVSGQTRPIRTDKQQTKSVTNTDRQSGGGKSKATSGQTRVSVDVSQGSNSVSSGRSSSTMKDVINTISNIDTKMTNSAVDIAKDSPIGDSGVPLAPWEFNADSNTQDSSSMDGTTRIINIDVPAGQALPDVDAFAGGAIDVLNTASMPSSSSSSSSSSSKSSSSSSMSSSSMSSSTVDSNFNDIGSMDIGGMSSTSNAGDSTFTSTTTRRRVINPGAVDSNSNSVVTITSETTNAITDTGSSGSTKETLDINKQLSAIEKQLRNAANSDKPVFAIIPMNAEANKANFQDFIDNLASNQNITNRTMTVTNVTDILPNNEVRNMFDSNGLSTLPNPMEL